MRRRIHQWLQHTWYDGGKSYRVLLPLSGVFWLLVTIRRCLYRFGILRPHVLDAPVIIVGNLTAGGTGKTPTTIWLARALRERGFHPGIVSRGYGGSRSDSPMRVDAASDPAIVGDEPVLLAKQSACPVAVDRSRVSAGEMLIEDGADLIIADDGLQHLRLARDYEICVLDGSRWLGNRLVLPAGPLRETTARLAEVDQIVVNGRISADGESASEQNAIGFELRANEVCRLNGSLVRPVEGFKGTTVHGVAAIGNPARFFDMLRALGMQVIEHAYPDHQPVDPVSLKFADDFDILMTEKDAVKIGSRVADRFWYVPVELAMDPAMAKPWLEQIESRMKRVRERKSSARGQT